MKIEGIEKIENVVKESMKEEYNDAYINNHRSMKMYNEEIDRLDRKVMERTIYFVKLGYSLEQVEKHYKH